VSDSINFLSKLTLRRVINAAKILVSYYFSKSIGKPKHWGNPISLSIEPTTACNLRCPECPSGLRSFTRDTGNLKKDLFQRTIEQISDDLIYLIFYFQGEPYIHPQFLDMVSEASQKGIYTITSTNAHFLDDKNAESTVRSGLDRLIISIDGTTQDTYESYRKGGKLEAVIAGTKNMVKWKKMLKSNTPYLIFQFLVVGPNEHQIPEIYKLAKELGVDEVKLKTAQIYDYQHGHSLIPSNPKYSRYVERSNGTYRLKHSPDNQCWKMWHSTVVTWDGRMVPCCFDKDAVHEMGNLKDNSFNEIWNGKAYEIFRKSIMKGRSSIDICTNCSEGCTVWA